MMIRHLDRDRAAIASLELLRCMEPCSVCDGERHAIDACIECGRIAGDKQERAPTSPDMRAQSVNERGGQPRSIPDDERAGIGAEGEPESMLHLLPVGGADPEKVGQVDARGGGGGGMEPHVGIEEQHRRGAGGRGENPMQEGGQPAAGRTRQ